MSNNVLDEVRAERGYTLSYHEIFARTEPAFLGHYADLYRAFTLNERYLSARERELVWVGILVADAEVVGTLHLERALQAGISAEEIGDAVGIAGVVQGWPALAFVSDTWQHTVPFPLWERYDALLQAAAPRLTAREIDLVALATQAVHQHGPAFLYHLGNLYEAAVPERDIAEAISYLLLPRGANAMLWATDEWLQALQDGRLIAGEELSGINTQTRRS